MAGRRGFAPVASDDDPARVGSARSPPSSIPWGTVLSSIAGTLLLIGLFTTLGFVIATFVNTNSNNAFIKRVDQDVRRIDGDLQRHYDVEAVPAQSGVELDSLAQEVVVANFCSKAEAVGAIGCAAGERCYVPLRTFTSDEDYITLDNSSGSGALMNVVAKNAYTIRLIAKALSICPYRRVRINVVSINGASETVLAFGYIGAHQSLNVTNTFVLDVTTSQLGIEVEAAEENAGVYLSVDGVITKTAAYDELAAVTAADLAKPVAWIQARPAGAPAAPSLQFPPQYPTSSTVYAWSSPVIPNSPINGTLPAGVPNNWGHKKQGSVPESIGIFMDLLIEELSGSDPLLSLFLTNREERGLNERRSAVYMSALRACIVKTAYREKTRAFLNRVYADVTTYKRPLLSAFKEALIDYLLDVHVGTAKHPEEVRTYFGEFIEFIGTGDPTAAGRNARVLLGRRLTPLVRNYFSERNAIVIANKDASSIIYYWHIAGLAPEGLVMESIHNAIAFEQFLNILFKLVIDKISGTVQPVAGTIQYNFFAKHAAVASDPVARLNVVREVMRLTVPNAVSFSKVVDPAQPGAFITSRLLHQSIMITNTGALLGNAAAYFAYNPALYSAFINYNTSIDDTVCSAADSSPMASAKPDALFTRANVGADTQTFFDVNNVKLIPVFQTPIYATFGLGYRRCKGEILVYDIVDMMLEIFAPLNWYIGATGSPATVCVAPFSCPANNIYAVPAAPAA